MEISHDNIPIALKNLNIMGQDAVFI